MGKKLRRDNRGVSLVEVMIVVAIMAALGGVGIMGINAMTGRPAQKCSQQIIYTLEKHRTSTMGKLNAKYELCRESNGKIVAKEYLTNEDVLPSSPTNVYELGDKSTKVTYECGGSSKNIDTATLTLQFNRSDGSFKQQADGSYCTKISVQRGGRTFNITLVPLTGKVYAD
ncbi:MAG: prepilin-type N-terminal cleavage/methylation domain-containing protein [Lachnospiraceae bacterium]|nr:prepilin-type N-terminal cleavage/methylation domain-containing protein [Lachnospiraceae bacterium]